MSFIYLSILLSAVIGLVIIAWIRSFDIYEKETFLAMFWAFLAGGSASVFVALAIYEILRLFGIDDSAVSTTIGSFLVIGPAEEFAKLVGLIIVYGLLRRHFNELTDGIIYMACVALGFSIIENYFYANSGEGSQFLLFYRVFISTPAHISFSIIIGYAWYRYKVEKRPVRIVIGALLTASILHGIFDALAFSPWFNFLLLIYLYLIINQSLKIIQYTNIISPFRPGFVELFDHPTGEAVAELECPWCSSAAPKLLFRNSYFSACRCDNCGHHIASVREIGKIFRIFAPEYKRFNKKLSPVKIRDDSVWLSVYGTAFFKNRGGYGFFKVSDMADRMKAINDATVNRFRKTSFISGQMLKHIFE
jgi:RsiW-degrading membrane proteinase PrsW (M82 family)